MFEATRATTGDWLHRDDGSIPAARAWHGAHPSGPRVGGAGLLPMSDLVPQSGAVPMLASRCALLADDLRRLMQALTAHAHNGALDAAQLAVSVRLGARACEVARELHAIASLGWTSTPTAAVDASTDDVAVGLARLAVSIGDLYALAGELIDSPTAPR